MVRAKKDVTEAELAVLELLWAHGTATIRELTDRLYPGGGSSEYATVQKLLERLEDKRYVRRDRRRVPHVFRAALTREKLIDSRLRGVADALCGGALGPLLTRLVEGGGLGDADIAQLRELVQRLDRSEEDGS